jgi:hypothetical protein
MIKLGFLLKVLSRIRKIIKSEINLLPQTKVNDNDDEIKMKSFF